MVLSTTLLESMPLDWSPELLAKAKAVTAKRAKTVIDHIFRHGYVTSDELQDQYKYRHTSRAIRDVRELGIPIESFRVRATNGRKISAYRFASIQEIHRGSLNGRKVFPKEFKHLIGGPGGFRCNICLEGYEDRYLQVDHRIPYEIGGEPPFAELNVTAHMLLCASCNRAKSWSCEHCPNWSRKDTEKCRACYWARPEDYQHVATEELRRLDVVWRGSAVSVYDALVRKAKERGIEIPEYVKKVLARHLDS